MKTLSLGQAARLREHGKTIFARAISGRLFAGYKEDGANIDSAESARVYPFPAPVETAAELRSRLALAEERFGANLAANNSMRGDMPMTLRLTPATLVAVSGRPTRASALSRDSTTLFCDHK
jgi:hypothetical protein